MRKMFVICLLLILVVFPAFAQEKEPVIFFSPVGDVSLYGEEGVTAGGGFTIGADGRVAVGFSGLYYHEVSKTDYEERILAMEFLAFLRVYLLMNKICTGPYLQIGFGPVLLFLEDDVKLPTVTGAFSVGLTAGWRIPLGKIFYLEPSVRGGYPFLVGARLAVGFRL